MSTWLANFAIGNLCIASLLAVAAWTAQRRLRQPLLAHLLWVLVLVKLLTPPLFTLPLLQLDTPIEEPFVVPSDVALPAVDLEMTAASTWQWPEMTTLLLIAWLVGSLFVLAWSLGRVTRFGRALARASQIAPDDVQRLAADLGKRLGLRRVPPIFTTNARISPMVFWLGGRVRVFVPHGLLTDIPHEQLRHVLAHELSHVRRGDHIVRWLEWLACVAFWWNPLAWLARRNLRINEEVCCDDHVLRNLSPNPHSYANSLLSVVEFLATPTLRPPAMASEINSGGFLERRLRMIVSKNRVLSTPRWLQAAALLITTLILPLGVAYAQETDVRAVGMRLRKAVQAGELTADQAKAMMRTLERSMKRGGDATDDRNLEARKKRFEQLERRVEIGIKEGKISEAEGKERLMAARDKMFGAEKKAANDERAMAKDLEKRLYDLKKRLGAAIKKGDLSDAEAEQVMRKALVEMKERDNARSRERVEWLRLKAEEHREADVAREHALRAREARRDAERAERQAKAKLEAARRAHDAWHSDVSREKREIAEKKRRAQIDMARQKMADAEKRAADLKTIFEKLRRAEAEGLLTEGEVKKKMAALKKQAEKDAAAKKKDAKKKDKKKRKEKDSKKKSKKKRRSEIR